MEKYFEDIRLNETKLTNKEEKLLIAKAQSGCTSSRDKVFYANARFAIFEARKRQMRHIEDELIQVASIGLYRAIDLFDVNKKNKFISYATWLIKSELNMWFDANYRTIRLPSNVSRDIYLDKINSTDVAHSSSSDEMEADALDIYNNYSEDYYNDLDTKKERIAHFISILTPREQLVVKMRIGFDDGETKTFGEIGQVIKRTAMQTSNVWRNAIRKLQSKYTKEEILNFFF